MTDPRPYRDIRYEVAGPADQRVATLTFARPEVLNAMTVDLIAETIDALDRAALDDDVRVVIVTGEGRAFSAGGDVRRLGAGSDDRADGGAGGDDEDKDGEDRDGGEAAPLPPTPFQRRAWLRRTQRMILAIRQVEKPIIAAVNGVAAGGGFDIACACDLRIASNRATFAEVFARIGLFPGTGGTYFLPRIVGPEKALELIWTGDMIDADEALRIGLVGRVVPHEQLIDEARALAARLAAGPPLALALAKAAVYRGLDSDLHAAFDYASTAEAITLSSEDHVEGIKAFRERRAPTFRGR